MKKRFKIFTILLLTMTLLLTITVTSFRAFNQGSEEEPNINMAAPTLTELQFYVEFKAYDSTEYANAQLFKYWEEDFGYYMEIVEEDGDYEYANECWDCTASRSRDRLYATADENISCFDYYGGYPFDSAGNQLIFPVTSPTPKTSFVPGDDITIEVCIQTGSSRVISYYLSIENLSDVLDDFTFEGSTICGTAQQKYNTDGSIMIGSIDSNNNLHDLTSPFVGGIISGTIKNTVSADFDVEFINAHSYTQINIKDAGGSLKSASGIKNGVEQTVALGNKLTVGVEGAKNTTDILTPSLGSAGTVSASGTPVTSSTGASIIQGNVATTVNSFESFTGSLTNPVTSGTNVALTVNGTDSSTIQKVVAVNCADPSDSSQVTNAINSALTNLTGSASGISGTSGGSYNIPMGNKGSTTYVAVLVESQDQTNQEIYFVQITNPLSNNKALDSAPTASNGVAGTSGVTTTTLTPTGGNNYKLTIPDDLDSFDLTTLVSDGQTITVNNNVVPSGTNTINVSDISGTSFTIEVEAEDGSGSTTYTVTLDKLSTDTSLSATDDFNIVVNGVTFNSTGKAPWTFADVEYVVSGSTATQFCVNNLTTSSDLTFTLKDGSSTVSFGSLVSFGSGVGELTKTLDVIVTAPAGNTNTTPYTLTVKRKAASNVADVDKSTISIYDHTGTEITDYTWTGDDCKINVKLPYAKADGTATGISIKATLPAFSTAEVGKGTALSTYTSGTTSTCYIFDASQTSVTVKLVVTAQDGTTQKTYTFSVDREAASQDVSLTAFEVRDENGVALTGYWNGTQYKLDNKLPYAPDTAGIKVYFENDEFATVKIDKSASYSVFACSISAITV